MLKKSLFNRCVTVILPQVAVDAHRQRAAVFVAEPTAYVGMSTPDSMQVVAKKCRKS